MKVFTVIVMRPARLMRDHPDFRTMQDLQYAAILRAKDPRSAGKAAIAEAFEADQDDFMVEPEFAPRIDEYLVLGHIEEGRPTRLGSTTVTHKEKP